MFLRIEGFQVEIKEINKTWERPASIKNFKIGEYRAGDCWVYFLNRMMFSEKQTLKVEKFHPLSSGQSMFTSQCWWWWCISDNIFLQDPLIHRARQ